MERHAGASSSTPTASPAAISSQPSPLFDKLPTSPGPAIPSPADRALAEALRHENQQRASEISALKARAVALDAVLAAEAQRLADGGASPAAQHHNMQSALPPPPGLSPPPTALLELARAAQQSAAAESGGEGADASHGWTAHDWLTSLADPAPREARGRASADQASAASASSGSSRRLSSIGISRVLAEELVAPVLAAGGDENLAHLHFVRALGTMDAAEGVAALSALLSSGGVIRRLAEEVSL